MTKKYFPAALILFVSLETGFAQPLAAEKITPASKASALQSGLPRCVDSEVDIAEIRRVQKANDKTSHKYDGYRKALHADSALELAARLAYAETVAASCPQQEDQVATLIAGVIGNRVRIRRGDVASVVFQRNQFSSSLNIYPESRYRDFLCPDDSALWRKVVAKVRANFKASKPDAAIPKDAVNYYLYRHSDRFKAPAWKLEEALIADEKTRECIRVFRNPAWK